VFGLHFHGSFIALHIVLSYCWFPQICVVVGDVVSECDHNISVEWVSLYAVRDESHPCHSVWCVVEKMKGERNGWCNCGSNVIAAGRNFHLEITIQKVIDSWYLLCLQV